MAEFTLEYWEDDGWFVGRVAEVPGVFSQGESETPFSPPHASRISVERETECN
jgi:hypothetical protein